METEISHFQTSEFPFGEKTREVDGKTTEARAYARQLFVEILAHDQTEFFTIAPQTFRAKVETRLQELSGAEEETATPEVVSVFLHELVDIITKLDQDDPEEAEILAARTQELLFSVSPSLFNDIVLPEQLSLLARLSRTTAGQMFAGGAWVGELAEELSTLPEKTIAEIHKFIESGPVSQQLDSLLMIETIGVRATGLTATARAVERTQDILRHFESSPYPLVQIMAKLAREGVDETAASHIQGVIQRPGLDRSGRATSLVESTKNEDAKLAHSLRSAHTPTRGEHFVLVAKDAVGIADPTGLIQRLATIETDQLREQTPEDVRPIRRTLAWFRENPTPSRGDLRQILQFVYEQIPSLRFTLFAQIDTLTPTEWTQLLTERRPGPESAFLLQRIMNERSKVVSVLQQQLDKQNSALEKSLPVVDFFHLDTALANPTTLPFSQTETTEEDVLLLQSLHHPRIRAYVEERLGLPYAEISLRGQLQLLKFLSTEGDHTYTQLEKTLQTPGLDRSAFVETFFAGAENPELPAALLSFAEKQTAEVSNALFHKYQEIVTATRDTEKLVADFFHESGKVVPDTRLVVQEILKRANRKLTTALASADPAEITEILNRIQTDTLHFGALFKTLLAESERVRFAEIRGLDLAEVKGNELNPDQKERMLAVFSQNYAAEPEFIERFRRFLFDESTEMQTKRAKNTFHLLTKVGKDGSGKDLALAFLRLEDTNDNRLYFAACNVHPELRGSGIGNQFLCQTILEAGQTHSIDATFPPDSPIGTHYIEALGFVGTGAKKELDKYHRFAMAKEAGATTSEMKKLSKEEVENIQKQQAEIPLEKLVENNTAQIVLRLNAIIDKEILFSQSEQLFAAGYTMPRYLCADQACGERLYGFEKSRS